MQKIVLNPIGKIHTPYKKLEEIPIQGILKSEIEGYVELKEEFEAGLSDLSGFSHAILIYYFHSSNRTQVVGSPFLENVAHGIFAIRSPHRPNHLGFSIVEIQKIHLNKVFFKHVDMLDGTPLLDIKPYVKYFDSRENSKAGWLETHFKK